MAVISVQTYGNATDAETGETTTLGQQSEVKTHMGNTTISTDDLGSNYESEAFSVERQGTSTFISSDSELKDTDIVTVGQGNETIQVDVQTARQLGLMPSLIAEINANAQAQAYGSQGIGEEPEGEYLPQTEAKAESPQDVLEHNLFNAVNDGDMTSTTAGEASLFADTVAMAGGTDLETALGIFAEASATGNFSNEMLQELNMADNVAQARLEGLSAAIEGDIRSYCSDEAFEEMRVYADRYDEANEAMRNLAIKHFTGGSNRSKWVNLHKAMVQRYGDRL